jgi:uncharacterized membrane protein (UPF0127 family)
MEAPAWEALMTELEAALVDQHPFSETHVALHLAAGHQLELRARVADTMETKALGMTGRSFDGFDAMLFVEPVESRAQFHMRGCVVPMQVLWFDSDGNFMDRASMDLGDELTVYVPQRPFRYALELPMTRGQLGSEGDRLVLGG